jgi:hypothetical protein
VKQVIRILLASVFLLYCPLSFAAAETVKEGFDEATRGNYVTALKILLPLAEKGDADAQNSVGLMFANGKGLPLDYEQAAEWYRKAASQGLAAAQYNLGVMYFNGRGVPLDYEQAAAWYLKSADQGLAVAQNNIGVLYNNGQGVSKDYAQAAEWYRKAAEQGLPSAESNIGWLYAGGQGVKRDSDAAFSWIRKSGEQGNISALDYIAQKVQPPTSKLPLPAPEINAPAILSPGPPEGSALPLPRQSKWFIADTAYAPIYSAEAETAGYGLYSYVILLDSTDRSQFLVNTILDSTPDASGLAWSKSQINLLLIPMKQTSRDLCQVVSIYQQDDCVRLRVSDIKSYDRSFARTFLYRICSKPTPDMSEFCHSSFGRGPFLFTYFGPTSKLQSVPPPYLFIDLSSVDQNAFGEYVTAYKDQIKSEDITDNSKINTLRLRVLSLILSATGIINPAQKAIAQIMHAPSSEPNK